MRYDSAQGRMVCARHQTRGVDARVIAGEITVADVRKAARVFKRISGGLTEIADGRRVLATEQARALFVTHFKLMGVARECFEDMVRGATDAGKGQS